MEIISLKLQGKRVLDVEGERRFLGFWVLRVFCQYNYNFLFEFDCG